MHNNQLRNYTGHRFVIETGLGKTILEPDGEAVVLNDRSPATEKLFWVHGHMTGLPVRSIREAHTVGLPPPQKGVYYIVSWPVAKANPDRQDLLIGDLPINNKEGRTIAVQVLAYLISAPKEET